MCLITDPTPRSNTDLFVLTLINIDWAIISTYVVLISGPQSRMDWLLFQRAGETKHVRKQHIKFVWCEPVRDHDLLLGCLSFQKGNPAYLHDTVTVSPYPVETLYRREGDSLAQHVAPEDVPHFCLWGIPRYPFCLQSCSRDVSLENWSPRVLRVRMDTDASMRVCALEFQLTIHQMCFADAMSPPKKKAKNGTCIIAALEDILYWRGPTIGTASLLCMTS
jgi:hypothetical protein